MALKVCVVGVSAVPLGDHAPIGADPGLQPDFRGVRSGLRRQAGHHSGLLLVGEAVELDRELKLARERIPAATVVSEVLGA
jgi:hypothetical protein